MSPLCTLALVSPTARGDVGREALEGSPPAASPDRQGCGEVQAWGDLHCPPVHPSAAPGIHMGHYGSLQLWGVPTSQIPPSRVSASPGKGTDGQTDRQLLPEGTAGTLPVTTQALLQQPQPHCASNGLRKGLLRPPSCTHCLSPHVPQGMGARSICPLQCAILAQHHAPLPAPSRHGPAAGSNWDSSEQG